MVWRLDTAASERGLCQRACALLGTHAAGNTTIKEIATLLGVSRTTLERHFAVHVGRTPGQELLRVRMERAKALLVTTNLPVKTIAARSGYRRVSNFSDFFRRQTGLSPREFRERRAVVVALSDTPVKSNKPQRRYSHKNKNVKCRKTSSDCVC